MAIDWLILVKFLELIVLDMLREHAVSAFFSLEVNLSHDLCPSDELGWLCFVPRALSLALTDWIWSGNFIW